MIKKFVGTFALAALMTTGAFAQEKTVRMGTEGYYPPFNFFDSAKNVKGFDVDIGNELCAHMKVKCEWVTTAWDGIIPALNASKFDTIIASMAITAKRQKAISFSNPYYFNSGRLVVSKEAGIKGAMPKDLKGKIIGTQSGTTEVGLLKKHFPNSKVKLYPKLDDALLDLENGRLDAVLASQFVIGAWLKKKEGACCEFKGEAFVPDDMIGTGIGVRKDDVKLQKALNKALAEMVADGSYDAIRKKYFPFDIMTKPKTASELFGSK